MDPVAHRLAALFVFGALAFFSPLLGAVNRPATFLGLPLFPLYLFTVWGGLLLAAWWFSRRGRR